MAFQRQDFVGALDAFEAALAARMDGPSIHYNIGVAAYRVGRYDRARGAFETVATTPAMAALAHYNLALVALAEKHEDRAIDLFAQVYATSDDERLRELARIQLETIGASDTPSPLVWGAYASVAGGYDDNVTLTSDGQQLGIAREGDMYLDSLLVGSLSLAEHWRIDADLSYLNYADVNEYDQWGAGVGIRYRFKPGAWSVDLGSQVGITYLDGEQFDLRESVHLQALRDFAATRTLRMRYRLSNVDASDDYPGLEGLRHELSARLTQRLASWTVGLGYVFERSDYDSEALSAQRNQLSVDLRVPLTQAWSARASAAFRRSEYDADDVGSENRFELGGAVEVLLTGRWSLALQYLFTDNDADTPTFAYQRNRISVGIDATF